MINQEVIVNQQLQERIHYENPEFPLARFIDQMDYFADGEFLCHWHPEFELAVILNGSIEYQIDQQIFQLKQGDVIFITSQALHSARQIQPGSVIFNIEFPPSLFHTVGTSFLYQNYFNPTFLRKMGSVAISAEQEEGKEILDRLLHILLLINTHMNSCVWKIFYIYGEISWDSFSTLRLLSQTMTDSSVNIECVKWSATSSLILSSL